MLRLLKIPQETGKVKWSDNYKRMLARHKLEEFGNLRLFLKQTPLVLEAAVKAKY